MSEESMIKYKRKNKEKLYIYFFYKNWFDRKEKKKRKFIRHVRFLIEFKNRLIPFHKNVVTTKLARSLS